MGYLDRKYNREDRSTTDDEVSGSSYLQRKYGAQPPPEQLPPAPIPYMPQEGQGLYRPNDPAPEPIEPRSRFDRMGLGGLGKGLQSAFNVIDYPLKAVGELQRKYALEPAKAALGETLAQDPGNVEAQGYMNVLTRSGMDQQLPRDPREAGGFYPGNIQRAAIEEAASYYPEGSSVQKNMQASGALTGLISDMAQDPINLIDLAGSWVNSNIRGARSLARMRKLQLARKEKEIADFTKLAALTDEVVEVRPPRPRVDIDKEVDLFEQALQTQDEAMQAEQQMMREPNPLIPRQDNEDFIRADVKVRTTSRTNSRDSSP